MRGSVRTQQSVVGHSVQDVVLEIQRETLGHLRVTAIGPESLRLVFKIEPILDTESEQSLRSYIDDLAKRGSGQTDSSLRASELIRRLGERYYEALLGNQPALKEWLSNRLRGPASSGRLIIASDDAKVHRELWETIRPPTDRPLIMRGLPLIRRLLSVPIRTPEVDQLLTLRVLWVAPQARKPNLPSPEYTLQQVRHNVGNDLLTVCSPATLLRVKEELDRARQNRAPFSILHYEGHGSFSIEESEGVLYFDKQREHLPDAVTADRLRQAVQGVPLVVMDACQAAATGHSETTWNAVAPLLLRENAQSVIAAPFSVHVDQMSIFAPKLYAELKAGKTICEAVHAGRVELMLDHERRTNSGTSAVVGMQDWWTIQLYQQGEDIPLVREPAVDSKATGSARVLQSDSLESALTSAAGTPAATGNRAFLFRAAVVAGLFALVTLLVYYGHEERKKQEIRSEWKQIEEEFAQCRNQNAFHCRRVLDLLTTCEQKKIQPNVAECSFRIGLIEEERLTGQSDLPRALRAYKTACNAKHQLACLNLGQMEEHGRGLPRKSPLMARRHYERGCELGNLEACANAALLYVTSEPELGLQPDLNMATQLYTKACNNEAGAPRGCIGVGTLLEKQGDIAGAHKWFSFACSHGDLFGCTRQGDLSNTPAEQQALYRKSCDILDHRHGACTGCIPLVKSLSGTASGEQEALKLYDELCWSGCEKLDNDTQSCCRDVSVRGQACRWLGWAQETGELGRSRDPQAALRSYQRSCEAKDVPGCRQLERLQSSKSRKRLSGD